MAKKLSLVVSVYNEEDVLNKFYAAFKTIVPSLVWDYELIFVNDGSNDKSLDILRGFAQNDRNIKVVSFSRNFGHEAAMLAGIDYACGDGIVCMDADLQHPLECIMDIIKKFEDGYDVISMIRKENKSAGLIKNITSKGFYKVINVLSDQTEFEENASDFFAISVKVANVIRSNYREKVRFLRGTVQSIGFNKTTIEYTANIRGGGKSHYNIKKLIKFSVDTIVCFSSFPLMLGIYAGLISAFIGLVVLVYSLVTIKGAPSGYTTLVTLNCFMFAILFIVVGIIGQYIAVLFLEIKDRPIYITDEVINFEDGMENND